MPRLVVHQGSLADQLIPAERVEDARWDFGVWGPSITVSAGDLVAQKTSDKLLYRYVAAGAGGLGVGIGISKFSFMTGTDGKPIFGATVATPNYLQTGNHGAPYYYAGIFDIVDLKIGGVAVAAFSDLTTAFTAARVTQQVNGFARIE